MTVSAKPSLGERIRAHVRALWPKYPLLPAAPFVLWPLYCTARGEFRWEFMAVVLLGGILPYVGPRSKRLYVGILPIGLVGILYDGMRFVKNVGLSSDTVHTCDLRALDARLFGVRVGGHLVPIHDYLQAHATLPLDLFFSVPYGVFIEAAFAFAVFLFFRDYAAMRRFMGAFLVMNVAGFVTYHLYPAAPPWYVHAHGCVVDLTTRANEGPNLARVDAFLGVPYFHGFYGRSNDVFGAVPSLHVAYPLLIALEGWSAFGTLRPGASRALRALSIAFVLWMAAAAVYLDHHWVIDVLVGLAYGTLAFAGFRWLSRTTRAPTEFNAEDQLISGARAS